MYALTLPKSLSGLKRDAAIYGAAIAVDRLSGFLVLPLLTESMDRSMFGAWTQVLTAFALVSNVLELGFYHSIVRYVPGAKRFVVGRVLHGMLAILTVNCAIFLVLALALPGIFSRLLFAQSEPNSIILAAAALIVTECFFEFVVLAFLRADGRIRVCAFYYVTKNVLRLLLLWQGLAHGAGLQGLLELLSISNAFLVVIVYVLHVVPGTPIALRGLEPGFWSRTIRYSGAIVLSTNLSWANVSLNRFLIVYLLGLGELGIYAANYSISSIVNIGALIVNFTVVPHLNEAWNRGDKRRVCDLLSTVTQYYCFATVPTGVAVGVFYMPLAHLLTSAQYLGPPMLIWWLVTFMILLGLEQLTTFATFLDNSHFSVRVRSLSLAINVVLNVALLKIVGVSVSAFAASISTVVVLGFNHWFLRRMTNYVFPWRGVLMIVVAAAAMGAVAHTALSLLPAQSFGYAVIAGFISLPVFLGLESAWRGSVIRQLVTMLGAVRTSRTT